MVFLMMAALMRDLKSFIEHQRISTQSGEHGITFYAGISFQDIAVCGRRGGVTAGNGGACPPCSDVSMKAQPVLLIRQSLCSRGGDVDVGKMSPNTVELAVGWLHGVDVNVDRYLTSQLEVIEYVLGHTQVLISSLVLWADMKWVPE